MSALTTGQVDWVEQPSADLLPLAEQAGTVMVRVLDPLGSYVLARFNCLYPPFDDVRLRRAVLLATSQDEFMQAMGGDPALSQPCRSFFPCGTPSAKEEGPEAMPGDLVAARALVKARGYDGHPVLLLAAADKAYLFGLASVAAELLNKVGLKSANGRAGWTGWFDDPTMEHMRQAWLFEPDPAKRDALAG